MIWIVANSRMELRRLQVKYRNLENGLIIVQLHTVVNGRKVRIDVDKIDGWAIYCSETKDVYYVAKQNVDVTKTRFSLRVLQTKQFQPLASPAGQLYRDERRLWMGTQEAQEDGLLNR